MEITKVKRKKNKNRKVEFYLNEEDGGLEKNKTFNRGEYNRLHNRPECAGASWSEEEDARLEEEFKSDISISEIARLHGRTKGGIRARLKKHGYEI